jgi:hypothetical protein
MLVEEIHFLMTTTTTTPIVQTGPVKEDDCDGNCNGESIRTRGEEHYDVRLTHKVKRMTATASESIRMQGEDRHWSHP